MDIYLIRNKLNNKVYIGQTIYTKEKRFKQHINIANKEKKYNHPFYNSIRKNGVENFDLSLLKSCETLDELNFWEEKLISDNNSLYPNGYNLLPGGNNRRHNIFSIEKIREYMKFRVKTEEFKQKCIIPLIHYVKSNVGREYLRKIACDEWNDKEYVKKQKEARKDMYSDSWRDKISETTKSAMYRKDVRIKYLKNFIKYLIRTGKDYIKHLYELYNLDDEYKNYCSKAFNY